MTPYRYLLVPGLLSVIGLLFALGGIWLWVAFAVFATLATLIDEIVGDGDTIEVRQGTWIHHFALYASLPLLLVLSALFFHQCTLWGAPDGPQAWHLAGGIVTLAAVYSTGGTNIAHELAHRTNDRLAAVTSRWLLAFTFDTTFAIEHINGHHKKVGTAKDAATARRGETVYHFIIRSTYFGVVNAAKIEAQRLHRHGDAVWGPRNRVLTGQLMSLVLAATTLSLFGVIGLLVFLISAILGKFYLEMINYIGHYGLVRLEGQPVANRHSWNSQRQISGLLLFNLTRHSDHHLFVNKPYWALDPGREYPRMPFGVATLILVALLPPLWNRVMTPHLANWDSHFASPGERDLLAASGRLLAI